MVKSTTVLGQCLTSRMQICLSLIGNQHKILSQSFYGYETSKNSKQKKKRSIVSVLHSDFEIISEVYNS